MDNGIEKNKKTLFERYKFKYFKCGFTLVELLAVIVILAIIMLIAIPAVLSTLTAVKRKGFVEYVDKIFLTTQKQVMEDDIKGNPVIGCRTFHIKTDLGLASTGKYDGFVLVKNEGNEEKKYYITMHDDEYKIEAYLYNGELDANNIERWSKNDELDDSKACLVAGCSSCSANEELTGEAVCPTIPEVSDSTPGSFSGKGTASDPYLIESIDDLVTLSNKTNDGSLGDNKYFKLTTDLSFDCDKSYSDPNSKSFGDINGDGIVDTIKTELTTSLGFVPIGNKKSNPFKSYIDGNSKKIYGLYINSGEKYQYTGFIGYALTDKNNSIINNISILSANVNSGGDYSSVVLAYGNTNSQDSKLENIEASGNLKCEIASNNYRAYCASISAYLTTNYNDSNYGKLEVNNLINKVNVKANEKYSLSVGGTLGYIDHVTVNNVYNYGSIEGYKYVGGAISYANYSKITRIYNYGSITCRESESCGGAAGETYYTEGNSVYNHGKVNGIGNGTYIGGAIGHLSYNVKNGNNLILGSIYNYGEVLAPFGYVGGAIGKIYRSNTYNVYNSAKVEYNGTGDCYLGGVAGDVNVYSSLTNAGNSGTVKSSGRKSLGGVVGVSEGKTSNVYNYGKLIRDSKSSGSGTYVGGVIGNGSCTNCYSIADIDNIKGATPSQPDKIGLVLGYNNSKDTYNSYGIGTITNTASIKERNHDFAAFAGEYDLHNSNTKNIYAKARITGFPQIGVFSGYSDSFDPNYKADNLYIDMYTDASEVKDKYGAITSSNVATFYANLNSSPNKKPFEIAQEYSFNNINGIWFQNTLKLGNSWKYDNNLYPKVYKLLPNGSISSELVEGQKDIPIK